MKRSLTAIVLSVAAMAINSGSIASAQTVYSQYPGAGQTYVISSSPSSDGGTITSTYTAPRSVSVGSTLSTPPSAPATYAPPQTVYNPGYGVPSYGTQGYGAPPNFDPYSQPAVVQANYQAPTYQTPGTVPANTAPSLPAAPYQTPTAPAAPGGPTYLAPTFNGPSYNPYVGSPVRTAPVTGNVVPVGYQVANYPQTLSNCGSPATLPPSLPYQSGAQMAQPYAYGYGTAPINNNYKPLAPIFSVPNGTYVSQGLLGQPKAYVNGQPVRNIFRYILP